MKNATTIVSLVSSVMTLMAERGYSKSMLIKHQIMYNRLERYCASIGVWQYSALVGERFVKFVRDSNHSLSRGMLRYYESVVRRLDCILSGIEWKRFSKPCGDYAKSSYDSIISEFEGYLCRTGRSGRRIQSIVRLTATFLADIERMGCRDTESISANIIIKCFEQATDKLGFRDKIGTFFQHAYI